MNAQPDPQNAYICPGCGTDNQPEHCDGALALDYQDSEPQCIPNVVCICDCGDCNPRMCWGCGGDL